MADIVVDYFLESLDQFLSSSNLDFNKEVKYQLRNLKRDIKYLGSFLKVTEKKRSKYPEMMKLVMQIRDVTCDADNIVHRFVLVSKADLPSDSLCEYPDHLFRDLERVEKVIKNLTDEVKQIYDENLYDINGGATEILEHSSNRDGGSGSSGGRNHDRGVKNEAVIGFGDHIEILMKKVNVTAYCGVMLPIISIDGAAGSGKTTLAEEVYYHDLTQKNFEIRAWVVVSQDYSKKTMMSDLLIGILKSACPKNCVYYENRDNKVLAEKVHKSLTGKRYLIVMDDIWGIQAWNDIERSLPRDDNGSKVIFTMRQSLVVRDSFPHSLGPLSETCSWELLEKKVFGEKRCPLQLVEVGKQIAERCDGLPLAIITTAGILANEEKTLNAWEKIAKDLSSIIAKKDDCMKILELSYNDLPISLRPCFLYIGAHLKDNEISVRELIWLWIAEGFIHGEDQSLEAKAKENLITLIERKLIMVARTSNFVEGNRGVKTCRIDNLMRELCLKKAKEDNFFVQIDGYDSSAFSAPNKHGRLFISRQFFNEFFFSRPYPRNLRSFLCLGSRYTRIELHISFFAETFQFLRVFSFIPDECQGEILRGQLVHLRYLALQLSEDADFRFPFHLVKLETLIVQTSRFKDIKLSSSSSNILKMVKLRHLYSKQGMFTYHVSCVEDEGNTLDILQTLQKMCICKHCLRFLKKTPNLRKLGLIGDPDTKGDDVLMLPDLEFLKCLQILYVESTSVARTGLKLPRSLTKLTLCHTQLPWEELSRILKSLPRLEFLKLLMDACSGPVWDTSELGEGFSQLKYLRLKDLDFDEWRASKDQFQKLEILVIQDCRKLKRIPIDRYKLKIKVERCSRSVEDWARSIQRDGKNIRGKFAR